MAVTGRLLYMGIIPFFLTVTTVITFLGIRGQFRYWMASDSERRFLEYKRVAPSRVGPGEQSEGYLPSGSGLIPGHVVNMKASDAIDVNRSIKDFRHTSCKDLTYEEALPKATVIISYSKEERSLLLRTLHSVVNRSPPQYLQNVFLVPFGNITSKNIEDIEKDVTLKWPDGLVRVIPLIGLGNLYDARMTGANKSKSEVLVFLNSHCEVAEGWMEPLVKAIRDDPVTVAVPVIDQIDPSTLAHTSTYTDQTGGFYFNFTMAWTPLPEMENIARVTNPIQPIRTAVFSGEAFAVGSAYLKTLGGFQPEMYLRGMDLEFSFRVWMCGGKINIHPCSRVGHLVHTHEDYDKLSEETEGKAMIQLAEVWMDEYRRLFYMYRKSIISEPYGGDFPKDHLLKDRMKCSSFAWYLDKVYTGRFLPDENVYSWGVVRNPTSRMCMTIVKPSTTELSHVDGRVYQITCDHSGNTDQTFSYTLDQTIRQEEARCLSSDGEKGSPVTMVDCRTKNDTIKWDYTKDDCVVRHHKTGLCLTSGGERNETITLEPCINLSKNQIWTFLYYLEK